MFHEFENGFCKVCGESLDYLVDNKLRDQSIIGPTLPVDDNQGTLPLTMNVLVWS